MDSDESDSNNAGVCVNLLYEAYLRIYIKIRRCVFLCFKKVLI